MINRQDSIVIGSLFFLALFIWLRDTAWMSSADDTLPILVSLPLGFWLGSPWKFTHEAPIPMKSVIIVIAFFLLGIVTDFTLLLAFGWTYLLWTWLSTRMNPSPQLMIFPILAFPWITLDAENLGWWFRLSGAGTTAKIFALAGFQVELQGTMIMINQLPISVEAACAGLNTLQSMLIAGSAVAYLSLKDTNRFWWNLPLLFLIAWLANTLRIVTLTSAALFVSPEFALGPFHTWGGWLVLILMFGLCWFIFSLQESES